MVVAILIDPGNTRHHRHRRSKKNSPEETKTPSCTHVYIYMYVQFFAEIHYILISLKIYNMCILFILNWNHIFDSHNVPLSQNSSFPDFSKPFFFYVFWVCLPWRCFFLWRWPPFGTAAGQSPGKVNRPGGARWVMLTFLNGIDTSSRKGLGDLRDFGGSHDLKERFLFEDIWIERVMILVCFKFMFVCSRLWELCVDAFNWQSWQDRNSWREREREIRRAVILSRTPRHFQASQVLPVF